MAMLPEVATYLAAAGIGLTTGTNLFLGRMPDSPDKCAAIYETTGLTPLDQFGGSSLPGVRRPGLQVLSRDSGYADSQSLAEDIWEKLLLIDNETLTSTLYLRVEAVQSPAPVERDSQDRMVFSCNFLVAKTT